MECEAEQGANAFEDYSQAVKRSLMIQWAPEQGRKSSNIKQPPQVLGESRSRTGLNLLLKFAPLKPFATEALIILKQPDGGRFKLPVSLLANQPKVEGRLVVELPNGSTPGTLKFMH